MSNIYKFDEFLNEGTNQNKTRWTMEMLQEEADKYDTRNDFSHGNSAAYSYASRKKLMDELFKNKENDGYSDKQRKSGYWSKERLEAEAEDCNTRIEFYEKNRAAYAAANAKKLMAELFKDKPNGGETITKGAKLIRWTEEMLQAEADKYDTIKKFREGNEKAYVAALYKKILDKLFADKPNGGRPGIGEKTKYWTEDRLKNEVENYNTRVEFYEKNREAYMVAANKRLLDKLFANKTERDGLTDKYRERGYWTKERLQAEVDKYDTRKDFSKYSQDAYKAAIKKKLIDELFINKDGHGMLNNVKK